MAKWVMQENDANIELMQKTLKTSYIMSYVLANRNIRTRNTALMYLNPELNQMHNTKIMKDTLKAIEIIKHSRSMKDKIVVYGDYDVDGVMSISILVKGLRELGCDVSYYIPHRENEGYGLNIEAVKTLKESETDLIITCDNGITSIEEIKLANELGIKTIIIDHHEPGYTANKKDILPNADAIINPKQQDCLYPFKNLCAAGICYKFIKLFFELEEKVFDLENEYIIFATIATFCDVVDLQDENRIISKNGLNLINNKPIRNIGLKSLLKEKSIIDKKLGSFDMGFIIGPCINASGRLETAETSVELFLSEDILEAESLAKKLSDLNEERKELTNIAVEKSIDKLLLDPLNIPKVIVMYDDTIHESIAGIVAGRIKDAFFHPTIVLTNGETDIKGSARSIDAYNIFENLYRNKDLFIRFGGHKMAAGLSLKKENINILKERLNENCTLVREDFTEIIKIDKEISLSEATYERAKELKTMEPFGKGNKEPLFLTKNVLLQEIKVIENKNTIIFTFNIEDSFRNIKAICFGKLGDFYELLEDNYDDYTIEKIINGILRDVDLFLDIVYSIDINNFRDNSSVQLKIKDFLMTDKKDKKLD